MLSYGVNQQNSGWMFGVVVTRLLGTYFLDQTAWIQAQLCLAVMCTWEAAGDAQVIGSHHLPGETWLSSQLLVSAGPERHLGKQVVGDFSIYLSLIKSFKKRKEKLMHTYIHTWYTVTKKKTSGIEVTVEESEWVTRVCGTFPLIILRSIGICIMSVCHLFINSSHFPLRERNRISKKPNTLRKPGFHKGHGWKSVRLVNVYSVDLCYFILWNLGNWFF